jgi:iron-sulfur cluster repair protein YtfE (RIC family)
MKHEFNKNDPIKRQVEVSAKDRGSELSPMSPPEAYNPPSNIKVDYDKLHNCLRHLVDEHSELKENLLLFENILKRLQKNSALTLEIKTEVIKLLDIFNQDFSEHNRKEEKYLFPILAKRFLEVGEHSNAKNPITPINVLEDEHTEVTKLANEAHCLWSLVFKITDPHSIRFLLREFLITSLKLIEVVRLHIFREDDIVFSLAQKHLTTEELSTISHHFGV